MGGKGVGYLLHMYKNQRTWWEAREWVTAHVQKSNKAYTEWIKDHKRVVLLSGIQHMHTKAIPS